MITMMMMMMKMTRQDGDCQRGYKIAKLCRSYDRKQTTRSSAVYDADLFTAKYSPTYKVTT